MIKKIYTVILAVALYFSTPLQAQVKTDSSTVIIFNSGTTKPSKSRSSESNIIKIAPLGFIAGKIPLIFERKLTDYLSVQLSAGLTSRNYSRSLWRESLRETEAVTNDGVENSGLPEGVEDQTDPLYDYTNRKAQIGYMFSVQPRLYFASEGLDGGFLGFSADLYQYKYSIPGFVTGDAENRHTGSAKNEYENIRDLMVHYGVQRLYDNLSMEYSLGLGLRNVKGKKYVAAIDNDTLYEGEGKYSSSDLNFAIGFKIGYHF